MSAGVQVDFCCIPFSSLLPDTIATVVAKLLPLLLNLFGSVSMEVLAFKVLIVVRGSLISPKR